MAGPRRELMRRGALGLALLGGLLVLVPPSGAGAQRMRSLHVDALAMRADKTQLRVGEVFHLAIHAHVREKITALDELVIPDVGTMQNEGDERHVTSSASGTDVIETLTLEPTVAGPFTFAGAYLDALDARNGKPSRFRANSVRVVVAAAAGSGGLFYANPWSLIRAAFLVALALLAAFGVLVALIVVRGRRRAAEAQVRVVAARVMPEQRTPRDEVVDAFEEFRIAPHATSVERLRTALFAAAGVGPGVTLRDALAATNDQGLRTALVAAEHTAFGPAPLRPSASTMLIDATEVWLR